MKTIGKCLVAVIIASLLQSCTVMYLNVRNKLDVKEPIQKVDSCNIAYSLSLTSVTRTNSYGVKNDTKEAIQKMQNQYNESTKQIFDKKGCQARLAEKEEEANFKIKVARDILLSALPQEYLAGLTLFIIPAWGTKENQYQYTFENITTKETHTYFIDHHALTQAFLFPVFWISFFMMDEDRMYKESLLNFIEASNK